ncbi:MAG: tripartite tricarboxylate transporter TctB family protein [Xanthobacteraceae bacterium]|nr:tripartite tricarboxylate transporter TctB family protein [Xanthobacteraceae bacterium]
MKTDSRVRNYWREEFALIAALLFFFGAILVFSIRLPFDARLFPWVIGTAGILLCLAILVQELRRRATSAAADTVDDDDPAANANWPRFATALLSAPAFGVVFWLFGFFVASLAAMFVMPPLMGYANRRMTFAVGLATVAFLALFFPYLVGVNLPHGVVGDWLIDNLRAH